MSYKTLYKIEYQGTDSARIRLSSATHEIFKAHFPEQAIFPGFMHFEVISDVFNVEIASIKRAKFMKIIQPEQVLRYEKKNNKFKVFCEEQLVASFSI